MFDCLCYLLYVLGSLFYDFCLFFKQKTAYELRISDWSSDVCSSDLRIDLPGQVFSRIHVDDIVAGTIAGLDGPPGIYNISDDLPASQNFIVEYGSALLDVAPPPLLSLEQAGLSAQARAFYAENRRVANGKAKRVLGWSPTYPTFKEGLRALACACQEKGEV